MQLNELHTRLGFFQRLALAALIFAIALALRFSLLPVDAGVAFITFYPAIVIGFYICGTTAGALLSVASALAAEYFFISPFFTFNIAREIDAVSVLIFLASAAMIGWIVSHGQQVEQEWRGLFNHSLAGVIALDPVTGKITLANPAACRILGYSKHELMGKSVLELTFDNEMQTTLARNQTIFSGEVDELEFIKHYRHKNGQSITVEIKARLERDNSGKPKRVVGNFIDITERELAQQKLKELNHDFQTFLDKTPDFIYFKDSNNCFRFASRSLAQIAGFSDQQDLIGKHLLEVFPEAGQDYLAGEQDLWHSGKPVLSLCEPFKNVQGELGWVSTNKWPLLDAQQNVVGIFGISRDVTEIKLMEEQVLASEKRYKGLLEDQTDLICRFQVDGTVTYVNQAFCEFFGVDPNAIVGRSWKPAAYIEDIPYILSKLSEITLTHPVVTIENRVYAANGEIRWVQFVNRGFFDSEGALIETQAVARDITAQKVAELTLREAEQRFRTTANTAPVMIWMSGLDKLCYWFNQSWLEFTGRSMAQEVGNGWAEGVHPGDFQRCLKTYVQAFDLRQSFVMDYRLRRADGEYRWIVDNGVPRFDDNGTFLGYIGSCIDISARKELESQLSEAKLRVEDLYNHAPCGYHSLGPDGTFLFINDTELRWLGYSRDEVVGKLKLQHLLTDAGHKVFAENFPDLLQTGHLDDLEVEVRCKNGRILPLLVSASAVYDGAGIFVMSRSVAFDMTELRIAREALKQVIQEQNLMLDNDLVGIVKVRDRKIVWANQGFARIFKYGNENPVGQSTSDVYVDDASYADLGESAYPLLKAGMTYRRQIEMQAKDGSKLWIDLSGVELQSEPGMSLWMMVDDSEIKRQSELIEHQALHDALTGLSNRLLLLDRLHQALANSSRNNMPLAVCFMDLDGFKPINDQYGHDAGDKVLVEISQRLVDTVRGNDTVARLGGDEFVILLTELSDEQEYDAVIKRVMEAINQPIQLAPSNFVQVGASIGIALYPKNADDVEGLMHQADLAMYESKAAGKNRVSVAANL